MTTLKNTLLACLLLGLGAAQSHGQFTFSSGSTGADGALNVTTNTTLSLPTNGIFNFTTIAVASNATLKFTPNDLNTPVYLLATGNVTIDGTIDVSGSPGSELVGGVGGPGGFAGGNPGVNGLSPGDGHGPGAGKAGPVGGSGAYGSYLGDTNHGSTYGSPLLVPMVGGSGSGAVSSTVGGAGGGGAILVASSTRIDLGRTGAIASLGGSGYGYYGGRNVGSGGAIRLLAPIVAATGWLQVRGGRMVGYDTYGGSGRIRIDCVDRRFLQPSFTPDSSVAWIGANMVVFATNAPRLDITQVAGTNIAGGSAVFFYLPQGSSTNQTVRVQARNFGAAVPIRVVLTPDHGASSSYDTQIDNSTINPASVTVPVVVPVNEKVQVNAWTR